MHNFIYFFRFFFLLFKFFFVEECTNIDNGYAASLLNDSRQTVLNEFHSKKKIRHRARKRFKSEKIKQHV